MKEQNNRHGKREAASGKTSARTGYWQRYRKWLAGLTRGQRIRYRLLEAATILAAVIILVYLGLNAWIRLPDQPGGHGLPGNPGGDFSQAELPDVANSGRRDGVFTFLLVGKDTAGGGNTDTMLLLSYDTNAKTIRGLNLPRDTMVNVGTNSKRLNAVYNNNKGKDKATQVEKGMAALKKQVGHLTGISPDYYVIVEWEAIGELVDALGGVEFEVPFDMDYDDPTPGQDLHIHQKAGRRLLSGDDAMQVIRHRKNNDGSHSNGDVGRLKIQQDFLKAVAKKCLQPATFLKVPALAEIFSKNVTTDLTVGNIIAFAQQALGMDPDKDVSFATAPIGASFKYRGAALITLDETGLLEILNDGMNPYLSDIQASDLQLVYQKGNGSFGVTNGVLADERMGQSGVSSKPKPGVPTEPEVDEPELPEEPEEPLDPGIIGDPVAPVEPEMPVVPETPVDPAIPQPEPELPPEGGEAPQEPEQGGSTDEPAQSGSGGAADLPAPDAGADQGAPTDQT